MESTNPTVLSAIDYGAFILVLVISFLIGVYYGFFSKNKQNTPEEYFLGSRSMGIIPVSISLVVTFVSSTNLIGFSTEVYAYGTHHWQYMFTMLVMVLATSYIFLPIFYDLQLPSTFSYLELRFGRIAQLLASFIFFTTTTLFVSINLYVPALVLSHIAGLPIHITTIVVGCVCIFYTAIGGFRAIIWADLFQALLMVGCSCAICYIGFGLIGGVKEVWEASQRGGRLILFQLNPDPTIRLTTWTLLFGHSFICTQQLGLHQTSIQRFLSMSNQAKARKALLVLYFGFLFSMLIAFVLALVIYTYYETCDPLRSGLITKPDQITSFFVIRVSSIVPGVLGVFVAGLFAGCLSTMSSLLNSSTVCLYEDFLRPLLPVMSHQRVCHILKLLTLLLGCIQIGLVFVVQKLGTIFGILLTIFSMTSGTTLGIFTLGMLLPKSNQKGAVAGVIASLVGVGSIVIGSLSKKPDPFLPMRTDGCQHNFTISVVEEETDDLPWIFRISFMYYATVGFILVYLVGYPVSLLTGGNKITDQRLLAPFIRRKSPERLSAAEAEEKLLSRGVNEPSQQCKK